MKEEYSLKTILVEPGSLADLEFDFELREVEKEEVLQFADGDIHDGIRQCIEHSTREGNHYLHGLDKESGKLLFIFGLCKEKETNMGIPWFLTSKDFKPPIDFIRKSPEVINDMFTDGIKVLVNYIHKDNTKSIKWLTWLGFQFTEHPFLETYLQFYRYKE